jgi:hypothetical protein
MGIVSGWVEGILLSLAFVGVFGIVIASLNTMYGQTNSLGLSDNTTEQLFITYSGTAQEQLEGGEVEFDAQQGITLKTSYDMAKDAISIIWTFIGGGWIENIADMTGLGAPMTLLARFFRIIWFLSLIFGMLYALFKVIF